MSQSTTWFLYCITHGSCARSMMMDSIEYHKNALVNPDDIPRKEHKSEIKHLTKQIIESLKRETKHGQKIVELKRIKRIKKEQCLSRTRN